MEVKAYKWENSTTVELKEIKNINKVYRCTTVDNYNEVRESRGLMKIVAVDVFETKTRYNYQVRFAVDLHESIPPCVFYSSNKKCDPQTVAREILKLHQQ